MDIVFVGAICAFVAVCSAMVAGCAKLGGKK